MFWTDNMCIPVYAQNPKDAMMLMDYFYQPQVEAVVEYYNDYVCPVPAARQVLLRPDRLGGPGTGSDAAGDRRAAGGTPPTRRWCSRRRSTRARSRDYYQFQNCRGAGALEQPVRADRRRR